MEIFGIIGMILVQFSTCVQIYKLYRSKDPGGLSVGFLWMIFVGLANYLTYSISIGDRIYVISNCIGMFFLAISIGQYYYYLRRKRQNISYNPPGYIEPHPDDPYP
jgi:uncharacterized protein with PQ loop repeat